jgi:hypothetical protein
MARMMSVSLSRVKCSRPPCHPPRCKPGLALTGTGVSRSPGCLCSFDDLQFNDSTRDQVYGGSVVLTFTDERSQMFFVERAAAAVGNAGVADFERGSRETLDGRTRSLGVARHHSTVLASLARRAASDDKALELYAMAGLSTRGFFAMRGSVRQLL